MIFKKKTLENCFVLMIIHDCLLCGRQGKIQQYSLSNKRRKHSPFSNIIITKETFIL